MQVGSKAKLGSIDVEVVEVLPSVAAAVFPPPVMLVVKDLVEGLLFTVPENELVAE